MIDQWLGYVWQLFSRYLYLPTASVEGNHVKYSVIIIIMYFLWDRYLRNTEKDKEKIKDPAKFVSIEDSNTPTNKMSDMQVAVQDSNTTVALGKDSEFESEATEETTLSELHKDLGHTKISEKSANFESNETTSLVEENRQKQTEASRSVTQSEKVEVSANRKDYGDMSDLFTGKEYLI